MKMVSEKPPQCLEFQFPLRVSDKIFLWKGFIYKFYNPFERLTVFFYGCSNVLFWLPFWKEI